MESKINLQLCANYTSEQLKSAMTECLVGDYIVDKLGQAIKRFNKEDLDLFYVYEGFKKAIENRKDVSFSSLESWKENHISNANNCMEIVGNLDKLACEMDKIKDGELLESFVKDVEEFRTALDSMSVQFEDVSFPEVVKEEYISNLINQLTLVDEGQFLFELGTMKFDMVPLDINKNRNKFVEKKLRRANAIFDNATKILNNEFKALLSEVSNSYKTSYKIAHATLSDGEKADESRKIHKIIPPHRHILDKLEDKFTEANEIKRQLHIHEQRLIEQKNQKIEELKTLIEENPGEKEGYEREMDSIAFVTGEYLASIKTSIERINEIEEVISDRYKILDRVENALKTAIPSENEMKRYSSISFKFEDLYVRLELAKSQVVNKDKDFVKAINTAIMGLGVLINLGLEAKDVFMRNTLLTAIFNSTSGIFDLVENENKSVELTLINFVTTRLVQYSMLDNNFTKDMQLYRHVANTAIRDIAMMMGKPFSIATMLDIIETIDIAIKQIQELVDTVNKNHEEQTLLLGDIFNI